MNFKLNKIFSLLIVIAGIALELEARRPGLYEGGAYTGTPATSQPQLSGRPFSRGYQPRTLGEMYAQQGQRRFGYGPGRRPMVRRGYGSGTRTRQAGIMCKTSNCRLGQPGSRPVRVTGQVNPVTGTSRAIACNSNICRRATVRRIPQNPRRPYRIMGNAA